MGKRRRMTPEQRARLDAEYRRMVTGSAEGGLPAAIGVQASAGAARGGKGAAQRGKGRVS